MKLTIEQWCYVMGAIRQKVCESREKMEDYGKNYGKYDDYDCEYKFETKSQKEYYLELREEWRMYSEILIALEGQKF